MEKLKYLLLFASFIEVIAFQAVLLHWVKIPLPSYLSAIPKFWDEYLPVWSRCFYLSNGALAYFLWTFQKTEKDKQQLDLGLPKAVSICFVLLGFSFSHISRFYWFTTHPMTLNTIFDYFRQLVATPLRFFYFCDWIFLCMSFAIYIAFTRSAPVISVVKFITISFFSPELASFITLTEMDTTKSKSRGQKNFWKCKVYFGLAIFYTIVNAYITRHATYGMSLKESMIVLNSMSEEGFANAATGSVYISLYMMGCIAFIIAIVDAISLKDISLLYWTIPYAVLGIMGGTCTFLTVFFMHIEYLKQKYNWNEKANWNDNVFFVLINVCVFGIFGPIGFFLPKELLIMM
eukprot:TRINITY_DN5802_c0_g1_i1.p1 TRINITY_DN5802_c0_g1~~TRINITY_DN5802_c0_g1_i1.p1  ORF type:complete len:347 (-),score=75.33 TRINITY_DN5802_c0_g1_i1:33-1073(-)